MATNAHFPDAPKWPEGSPPPEGHNRPPVDVMAQEDFDALLLKERPQFLQKLDDIIGSVERVQVTNEDQLGRAGDVVKSLRQANKHVDEVHREVKAPYLAAGRAIDAKKNDLVGRISEAKSEVERRANAFIAEREAEKRAEQQRIAAEQRRQEQEAASAQALRDEAAAEDDAEAMEQVPVVAAPVAQAAKPEPVRSATGTTVSGKKTVRTEVTDFTAAFGEVKDNPKVQEAISKAVAGLARAGKRSIAGTRVWEETKMAAR